MVLTALVVAAEVRLQRKQLPGSAHRGLLHVGLRPAI